MIFIFYFYIKIISNFFFFFLWMANTMIFFKKNEKTDDFLHGASVFKMHCLFAFPFNVDFNNRAVKR